MTAWHLLFWLSAAYVAYTYVGYPALLFLWRLASKRQIEAAVEGELPTVSVIVTVRNEEEAIGPKLQALLEQDYPPDRYEVWIASDQSSDWTNDVARGFTLLHPHFHLVEYGENLGKAEAINQTVPRVGGEVVVLSDARQRVERDAVRRVARHFADPRVGIVGAEMTLVDESGAPASQGTGLYWRYERALRRLESSLGLLAGVSGAFFAIRRSLFRRIPPGSYCEDVTLALYARQAGCDVRWEPEARVYERVRDGKTEFKRKVRTLVGNYQLLAQFWPLYLPWNGKLAFTLISHKVCRLFIPVGLLALLSAALVLAPERPFFQTALAAQAAVYGAGALGLARRALLRSRLVNACGAFCLLNWAALVALAHVARKGPHIEWK